MYIARDKDGSLFLYEEKPVKGISIFFSKKKGSTLDPSLFKDVTWENSPIPVKLSIDFSLIDSDKKINSCVRWDEDWGCSESPSKSCNNCTYARWRLRNQDDDYVQNFCDD